MQSVAGFADCAHGRRLIAPVFILAIAGCIDAPNYEGRLCDLSAPCPSGLVCDLGEARCRTPCHVDADCEKGKVCDSAICRDAAGTACPTVPCPAPLTCGPDGQCYPSCTTNADCTHGAICDNGLCHTPAGTSSCMCADPPNECHEHARSCDSDGACIYPRKTSTATCSDGNACTTGDFCMNGDCQGAMMIDCDDHNPCTDDTCDPMTGCVHTNNQSMCDDGNVCTVGDQCVNGSCRAGTMRDCDDGNGCTLDSCDSQAGCVHTATANGSSCKVGTMIMGTCHGGTCTASCTQDLQCNDGNVCTDDRCTNGQCVFTANTAACDDQNACTYGDRCAAGACAGTPVTCTGDACVTRTCNGTSSCTETIHSGAACADDGNPCTSDTCDASGACQHPKKGDGTSCGAAAANRCCNGTCVDISSNASNCGGCGTACAAGHGCESVAVTTACSSHPAEVSGRCTCSAANAECQRGQVCRTFSPYTNRCTPLSASNCAPGEGDAALNSCPDYCHY